MTSATAPLLPGTDPGRLVRRSRFWPSGLIWVAIPFVLGQLSGAVTFAVNPNAASDIGLTEVPVPAWVFITVWSVIYPAMGVAAWCLWRDRAVGSGDVWTPLAVLTAGFLQTHSFWLTDSLRTTAVLDAIGVLLAVTTWWVTRRQSRVAARWLLPWLIWMPVTLVLKLVTLSI